MKIKNNPSIPKPQHLKTTPDKDWADAFNAGFRIAIFALLAGSITHACKSNNTKSSLNNPNQAKVEQTLEDTHPNNTTADSLVENN